jgi:hypothetical protein
MESTIYVVKKDELNLKAFATKEDALTFASKIIDECCDIETQNEIETENSTEEDLTVYKVYICTPGYVYGRYRYEVTTVTVAKVTFERPLDFDMDATLIEPDLTSAVIQEY